jgi:excinuclease ABC subunit B
MEKAIKETNRRRKLQTKFNEEHGIVPKTIIKDIRDSIKATFDDKEEESIEIKSNETIEEAIDRLTKEMFEYAKHYEFEKAAMLRDLIRDLKAE